MEDNNETVNSVADAFSQSEGTVPQRPKLRKIKRPKLKPTNDILQTPQKIISEQVDVVLSQSPSSVNEDSDIDLSNTSGVEKRTDLITSTEAHNITAENDYKNSYVLDGLPPELDYVTDGEDAAYVDGADYVKKNIMYITAFVCLLVGLFIGKTLFSSTKTETYGLEGVVLNPDVPAGRPRCGLTDKSQACVFYLMNWYKQELTGRDFYRLAAQLTDREEYMIETENLRYGKVIIKPGYFAQLNIPALK